MLFRLAFSPSLASPALAQPADLVLRGGKVITVDKDFRVAEASPSRTGVSSRSAAKSRSPATSGRARR